MRPNRRATWTSRRYSYEIKRVAYIDMDAEIGGSIAKEAKKKDILKGRIMY